MATITEVELQDGSVHQIGGSGGGNTYTLTKSGNTITLTGSGGDSSSVTDSDTTYTMSINGQTLTLTPSTGSPQSVTLPDDDTTYTLSLNGHTITLTSSGGETSSVTVPDENTTYTVSINGNDLTLTPSSGTAQTVTLPIPSEKVFVATYGTTTFAELLDAYNAEKVIYLKRARTNFTYYYPASVIPGTSPISNFFLYFTSGNRTISRATLTSGNSWSISTYALQEELVSGTNIKTINGQSLLGSGDLPVAPPVTSTDVPTADTIAEFDSDAHMNSTDMTTQEVSDFVDGLSISGGGVVKENVTPTSGSNYNGYGNCYYEVMGKLVHFHVGISGLTANTSTTIYTMPSGLRPSTTMSYKGNGGNTDSTAHLFANSNGTITVNSPQQYAMGEIWYFAS